MADKGGHLGTRLGIPYPGRAVPAGGQVAAFILVPDGPPYPIDVSDEGRQLGPALGVELGEEAIEPYRVK